MRPVFRGTFFTAAEAEHQPTARRTELYIREIPETPDQANIARNKALGLSRPDSWI
jgi:hypothetical protein